MSSFAVDARDVADAKEYMNETYDAEGPWQEQQRVMLPLDEILDWDDYTSWGEWDPGELGQLTTSELEDEFAHFRGKPWSARALRWLERGNVPAIVLAEARDGTRAIADGRGRVSLAVGLGFRSLPAIIIIEGARRTKR